MVGQHTRRIGAFAGRNEPHPPQPRQIFAIGPAERRIMRGIGNRGMHAHVLVKDIDLVAGGVMGRDIGGQRGDQLNLIGRGVLAGQPAGKDLKLAQHGDFVQHLGQ